MDNRHGSLLFLDLRWLQPQVLQQLFVGHLLFIGFASDNHHGCADYLNAVPYGVSHEHIARHGVGQLHGDSLILFHEHFQPFTHQPHVRHHAD